MAMPCKLRECLVLVMTYSQDSSTDFKPSSNTRYGNPNQPGIAE